MSSAADFSRKFVAEALGTGLLLATVVGSGIMAEQLAGGNAALALLANALATGAGLVALILTFGPVSGAHFNPAVTMAAALEGDLSWAEAMGYFAAQFLGAVAGVVAAHVMFDVSVISISGHIRNGPSQLFSEFVATFGLLSVIWSCSRRKSEAVPYAVAAYIVAAYWFTASTSFANPAAALARALTNSFAGIRPLDVPGFIGAELTGAVAATLLFHWLVPAKESVIRAPATQSAAQPGWIAP